VNLFALLNSILRRRAPEPLTEEQIAALAKDGDAFEERYAWCDRRIDYSEDEAR